MNRFGQVPVLRHGDRFIAQSNAILQYLAEHFGRFLGRSDSDRWRIAEWLSWDFDRFSTGVGLSRSFAKFQPQTPEDVKSYMHTRGEQAFTMLDRQLGTSKFLVGPAPTIADIAVFVTVIRRPARPAWPVFDRKIAGSGRFVHPWRVTSARWHGPSSGLPPRP